MLNPADSAVAADALNPVINGVDVTFKPVVKVVAVGLNPAGNVIAVDAYKFGIVLSVVGRLLDTIVVPISLDVTAILDVSSPGSL